MQNHLLLLPVHINFYSMCWFKRVKKNILFPMVKMVANYAKIGRVGKLEAAIQQVLFDQIF